jgi:hypothetical protein
LKTNECSNHGHVCDTCRAVHIRNNELYDLVNLKVDKKDTRLRKALEEHSGTIQASLDEGKARFTKIEDRASLESLTIRDRIDLNIQSCRNITDLKFDKHDTTRREDIKTLILVLVPIACASLASLITAIIIFTFLRADVVGLQKQVKSLLSDNAKSVEIHSELRAKKVIR